MPINRPLVIAPKELTVRGSKDTVQRAGCQPVFLDEHQYKQISCVGRGRPDKPKARLAFQASHFSFLLYRWLFIPAERNCRHKFPPPQEKGVSCFWVPPGEEKNNFNIWATASWWRREEKRKPSRCYWRHWTPRLLMRTKRQVGPRLGALQGKAPLAVSEGGKRLQGEQVRDPDGPGVWEEQARWATDSRPKHHQLMHSFRLSLYPRFPGRKLHWLEWDCLLSRHT